MNTPWADFSEKTYAKLGSKTSWRGALLVLTDEVYYRLLWLTGDPYYGELTKEGKNPGDEYWTSGVFENWMMLYRVEGLDTIPRRW